ncbi:hypothetical protein FQA47_003216 [Oryzias melastigma]|uniref:Uncharacterized protein n=1 Tax=Oryzias melastigma TaxID=30732 RepID=A0A834F0A1_ORYME|nr:hypothetical protein FQA47_003216 [Oryzias melastigma]
MFPSPHRLLTAGAAFLHERAVKDAGGQVLLSVRLSDWPLRGQSASFMITTGADNAAQHMTHSRARLNPECPEEAQIQDDAPDFLSQRRPSLKRLGSVFLWFPPAEGELSDPHLV